MVALCAISVGLPPISQRSLATSAGSVRVDAETSVVNRSY